MRILVDADSMNERVREIIAEQAQRWRCRAEFYANRWIVVPRSRSVRFRRVRDADRAIIDRCAPDDLAVTRDISLAAELIERKLTVLNDRGDVFTAENIQERLDIRNRAKELRDGGRLATRPRTYGKQEVHAFANALDRELARRLPPPASSVEEPDQNG